MKESLEWTIFATDIADYLTKKGLPFRQSYSVVGALIKEALMSEREFGKFSLAQLKKISPHFEKDVFELLSAKASVGRRDLVGGTSPRAVKEQIKELSGAL
jgi:argininosuccinate lyase